MYDVVPGTLQRLREADIVSMAGLTAASLGQEYCRIDGVQATKRRGARLSGIVEVPNTPFNQEASTAISTKETEEAKPSTPGRYNVEVEMRDRFSCLVTCTCNQSPTQSSVVCQHAAALLYHWIAHPMSFRTSPTSPLSTTFQPFEQQTTKPVPAEERAGNAAFETSQSWPVPQARTVQFIVPASNTAGMLAQSGLSELRGIAREYGIVTNGLNKQQLAEAVVEALKQPDAVRRVVATLEKQQRQLLAALTLAGGSMNDEDLRGLAERFSLGGSGQLQSMLLILQAKALIVRAALNSSMQQRVGLSGSALEVSWHIPSEVRAALHVTLPITPFTVEAGGGQDVDALKVWQVEPYSLLEDLLLVARALDGSRLEHEEKRNEGIARAGTTSRSLNPLPVDGSIAIPPPEDMPTKTLLETLQAVVPRPLSFLRFAMRLLKLAGILYRDDAGTHGLHVLPNAAVLLLGPRHIEVAHELFTHWLNQPTYEELFDLQEEGLSLRCRATPLNLPALRAGELETENRGARQTLLALLEQAPAGQWITFSAFARFVYRLNPTFMQKRQRQFSSPHWWLEQEDGRALRPTQLNDWLRAEGRYLAQLLQGPLHWWGVCDVVLSADERLLAFKLTPLADAFLRQAPVGAQSTATDAGLATSAAIDVAESDDLLIACTFANWHLIELIERFAEVRGVHAGQLCYRLTPQSLSDAFSRGESPGALLDLMRRVVEDQHTQVSDSPLARLLAQLERRVASYGRVRLYTDASLLEAADQLVLRELNATTSLQEQVVRPIQPTLLLLKRSAVERLLEELKRRGQVPLLHEAVEPPFFAPRSEEGYGTK